MKKELHNDILTTMAFPPKAAVTDNTAQVSAIIDTYNYESLELVLITGVESDADATFALLMEEGDVSNLSDAAAIDDNDLLGTEAGASFTFANDSITTKIGYKGSKRYVRATVTPANNTGNLFLSGVWIQGHSKRKPNTTQLN
jgi:hypothetical protein